MIPFTLQINLSAGDADYAQLTVPRLLAAHPHATERLLVVDLCKPQRTRIVDPARRYPEPRFTVRATRVADFAAACLRDGKVDRVVCLRPGDPLFARISSAWLRPSVTATHDYGGCALMAYFAAFELCRTPYLLHYDADMILHQEAGFDWADQARDEIESSASLIAATPRPTAPVPGRPDIPSLRECLPYFPHRAGWRNAWFSTRCYLFNVPRLRTCLPLIQGRYHLEMLVTRLLRRGYPRSPEIMLHRRLSSAGYECLMLSDPRAWMLHPCRKGPEFVAALPALLDAVAADRCPDGQRGVQDLELPLWENHFR